MKNQTVFTAGVFDLFHAGHMESINKILSKFPEANLIIGVATDYYTESFKRAPFQSCADRMHTIQTIFSSNQKVRVIQDPLLDYTCNYEKPFYDEYGITDHCQGTDFDENPQVYAYIKSVNGFHEMGRSTLMSTTELIQKLSPSEVKPLGGATNVNFKLGQVVIKKVIYGSSDFIDKSYKQLAEKQLFGVKSYQRFDDLVFLPYIDGNIAHDLTTQEVLQLSSEINNSGLKPDMNIIDVLDFYEYKPDKEKFAPLLNDMSYVSHGDLAYTNVVRGQQGVFPIDWENLCYSVKYWDFGCYLASIYIYGHYSLDEIRQKLSEVSTDPEEVKLATLAMLMLCEYWIQWSIHTGHEYFPNELKMLKKEFE